MRGVQVLDQHKAEAGLDWQVFKQLPECLQATGRGADAHNRAGWVAGPCSRLRSHSTAPC